MVLPPPAADDAPGPDTTGWLRRLKVSLRLSRAGLLVLVDRARLERLGELVRALSAVAPELEVHTEVHRLLEVPPGATLVLVPQAEDADWLNLNRPLFASRALRVVLFCTREVSVALFRRAVDFMDWVSLRLECPEGPAPYAVEGLRGALAARAPGVIWTGGDLEASFAVARPRRVLRRVSAARPYEELLAEAKAGRADWLAWTEVDGGFRLRRVRWALAEAGRRTRTVLVEPSVPSPGWWEVHGRVADLPEAREQLARAGAKTPGRLAALVNLEPEALPLLMRLLMQGVSERSLEEELLKATDPGAAIGRLATVHALVSEEELAHRRAPPPVMRALTAERSRTRLRLDAAMEAAQRLRPSSRKAAEDEAEALLRYSPRTGETWPRLASMALDVGDLDVAHVWALRAADTHPAGWIILARVLRAKGQLFDAEALLRHRLTMDVQGADRARGWTLHELGSVLAMQGRYTEAEELLHESLAITEQTLGPQSLSYGEALHELAKVLEWQGRYSKAEELLRRTLVIIEQELGLLSPKYGASLIQLASVLDRQGRYVETEKLLRQTLSIYEQTLGPQHPNYGAALHELAHVFKQQGQYVEAENLLRQALAITEQTLGTQHNSYAMTLNQLAQVLGLQGQDAEAEKLLRQSLSIQEQVLGPQHPDYGLSLPALASAVDRQGRYAEAELLLRQSLAILEQALGHQHSKLCPTLANLGFNLAKQQRPSEGEPLLLRSVNIARETLGPHHPTTAQALSLLAVVQAALRKPEAATTAQEAMDALSGSLGLEHPFTKDALPMLIRIVADSAAQPRGATPHRTNAGD